MGHGTPHFSNVVYPAMQAVFHMMGRTDVYVGTVEGWPEIDAVCGQLCAGTYTHVRTAPFMLVAGDHALNDMAGDERTAGRASSPKKDMTWSVSLEGMGVIPGVQDCTVSIFRRF